MACAASPAGAEVGEPGFEFGELVAAEVVDADAAVGRRDARLDEFGFAEDAQVFADEWLALLESVRELADGGRLVGEELQDQPPGGVGEDVECSERRQQFGGGSGPDFHACQVIYLGDRGGNCVRVLRRMVERLGQRGDVRLVRGRVSSAAPMTLVYRDVLVALGQRRFVLNDDDCRLGRPRLARLSSVQQAEAVELLARLLLDAADSRGNRRSHRPAGTLRRLTSNPARRSR